MEGIELNRLAEEFPEAVFPEITGGTPVGGMPPGESPVKAAQAEPEKAPKNVMINHFPEDLYWRLRPSFIEWDQKNDSPLGFGRFLISLLKGSGSIAGQLSEITRKYEAQKADRDRLANEAEELRIENEAISATCRGYADELARKEKELREARASAEESRTSTQTNSFPVNPGQVPAAGVPGAGHPATVPASAPWDAAGYLAGLTAVVDKAAELTAPGIFTGLRTYTKEQYLNLFNDAYQSALK